MYIHTKGVSVHEKSSQWDNPIKTSLLRQIREWRMPSMPTFAIHFYQSCFGMYGWERWLALFSTCWQWSSALKNRLKSVNWKLAYRSARCPSSASWVPQNAKDQFHHVRSLAYTNLGRFLCLTSLEVDFDASIGEYLWNAGKLNYVILPRRTQLKLHKKIHTVQKSNISIYMPTWI